MPIKSGTIEVRSNQLVGGVPEAGPTSPRSRILTIDTLRGVAVLSILPMNMQIFALYPTNVIYPYVGTFTDSTNVAVWTLLRVFVGSVGLTFFSLLFGAGIAMMDSSHRAGSLATLHYRRMGTLFVFGLAHAYLIWAGDILVTYAICGSAVFLLRSLRWQWLLPLGAVTYMVPMCGLLTVHFVLPNLDSEAIARN